MCQVKSGLTIKFICNTLCHCSKLSTTNLVTNFILFGKLATEYCEQENYTVCFSQVIIIKSKTILLSLRVVHVNTFHKLSAH